MSTAAISNNQGVNNDASREGSPEAVSTLARRILVVSSGGGHWVQLKRILPAFEGCELVVATVPREEQDVVDCTRQLDIPDATRWGSRRPGASGVSDALAGDS